MIKQGCFQHWGSPVLILLGVLLLAGCVTTPPGEGTNVPYRPPTLSVGPTATPAPTAAARPTPAGNCTDNLTFRTDATIPDGTSVAAASTLDKRWEVENTGTCNWDERYQLRLIAGPELGAPVQQPLAPARAASRVVLRLELKAPDKAGAYRSAWQAFNPAGQSFGDPVYIDIVVK